MKSYKSKSLCIFASTLLLFGTCPPTSLAFADDDPQSDPAATPITPSVGGQTGTGSTDMTMVWANGDAEYGGAGGQNNPDEDDDGQGDNFAFTVPSKINFLAKANGTLIGPSTQYNYIENLSAFTAHVSSLQIEAKNNWHFVEDATNANDVTDAVDVTISAGTDALKASDYEPDKADVGDASQWNMAATNAGTDDQVHMETTGHIANVTQNLSDFTTFGAIHWFVKAGTAEAPEPLEPLGTPKMKYAVSVYDIGKDTLSDGDAGLTFGPATGADYVKSSKSHNPTGTTAQGNAHLCVHNCTWTEIVEWNAEDPYVFEQCISKQCTKSIPLSKNKTTTILNDYFDATDTITGDGPSQLYHELNQGVSADDKVVENLRWHPNNDNVAWDGNRENHRYRWFLTPNDNPDGDYNPYYDRQEYDGIWEDGECVVTPKWSYGTPPRPFSFCFWPTRGTANGGWGASRIRAMLNGADAKTDTGDGTGPNDHYASSDKADASTDRHKSAGVYNSGNCLLATFPKVLRESIGSRVIAYYDPTDKSPETSADKLWLLSAEELGYESNSYGGGDGWSEYIKCDEDQPWGNGNFYGIYLFPAQEETVWDEEDQWNYYPIEFTSFCYCMEPDAEPYAGTESRNMATYRIADITGRASSGAKNNWWLRTGGYHHLDGSKVIKIGTNGYQSADYPGNRAGVSPCFTLKR